MIASYRPFVDLPLGVSQRRPNSPPRFLGFSALMPSSFKHSNALILLLR
jgi:hypothetical protein